MKSCIGCKYLYAEDDGYSNWTVLNTSLKCAKDRNPNLPCEEPYDWVYDEAHDNLPATRTSRCELYAPGEMVRLDIDEDNGPADFTADAEAIAAICAHAERGPHGDSEETC